MSSARKNPVRAFIVVLHFSKRKGGAGAPLFCFKLPVCALELEAQRELCLTRVAHAKAQEAVEVEECRSRERVDVVLVVERVEHFHLRNDRKALAEAERPRNAEVKRKERIVFANRVAPGVSAVLEARFGGNRLRRVRLHADV